MTIPTHLSDLVQGARAAVFAARAAVADSKNVLLVGEPGSGSTLIARALTEEVNTTALRLRENKAICQMAGQMAVPSPQVIPFRAPHHSCSLAGLIGGGKPWRPGEASLAHGGILYLEEAGEHSQENLNRLWWVVVEHKYTEDTTGKWRVPAEFILVGTTTRESAGRIPAGLFDVILDVPNSPEGRT